jgi:hypothetical protein
MEIKVQSHDQAGRLLEEHTCFNRESANETFEMFKDNEMALSIQAHHADGKPFRLESWTWNPETQRGKWEVQS